MLCKEIITVCSEIHTKHKFTVWAKTQKNSNKNICWSLFKYPYFCQILMKLKFSREIFEKSSNIKFHENPSTGNRVVPCGRADGHT